MFAICFHVLIPLFMNSFSKSLLNNNPVLGTIRGAYNLAGWALSNNNLRQTLNCQEGYN